MWHAEVYVTFKRGVIDPQGETIRSSLVALGFGTVSEVKAGKFMTIKLEAASENDARAQVEDMCRRLLANPVIEEYRFAVRKLQGEA